MNWLATQRKLNGFGYALSEDGLAGQKTYGALFAFMGAKDAAPILGKGASDHFEEYRVNTPLRVAHWLAQFAVESANFTRFEENLNYSAERLCAVWPKRFPSPSDAEACAGNPEALANKVYGGRMGNDEPGDGWKYRGRGPQITGKANYAAAQQRTGLPLVDNPDLAAKPENFVLLACDYWAAHQINDLADKDDLRAVTLAVNGAYNGISDRAKMLGRAERVIA